MSRHTLKRCIEQSFPNQPVSEIERILTRWGRGPSHAASNEIYRAIVELANGSKDRLCDLTNEIIGDQYVAKLLGNWHEINGEYREVPSSFSFVSDSLPDIAYVAIRNRLRGETSQRSLVLQDMDLRARCFVVPLLNRSFFVTTDNTALVEAKTADGMAGIKGSIVEGANVARTIEDVLNGKQRDMPDPAQ